MLDHDWTVEETGDATLVEVVVRNPTAVVRRVRVENRLDGPALPPGREGVADPAWDETGFEGTVPPNDRLTLGYACRAAPVEPPVEVVDEGRATGPTGTAEGGADAADAVRALGDHAPPVDALPDGAGTTEAGSTAERTGASPDGPATGPSGANASAVDSPDEAPTDVTEAGGDANEAPANEAPANEAPANEAPANGTTDAPPAPVADMLDRLDADGQPAADAPTPADGPPSTDRPDGERDDRQCSPPVDGSSEPAVAPTDGTDERAEPADLPDGVASWLADLERRVERGERLTGASVVEAAAVVEDCGGVDAVATLADGLAADERALRALADRVDDLADRAAATEVPVEALRSLS
ncbi:MAG: hypothetical protein ABEJ61_09715 [Haloferacaceae archaeon]